MNMQVTDIKENPKNPRKIKGEALEALKKSLNKFGDLGGIVYNVKTQRLVGGHQRIKTFDKSWVITKKEHTDSVGTVAIGSIETPFGLMSYREVSWDENTEKMANLAANQHGGDFVNSEVYGILEELKIDGEDLSLSGFTDVELNYGLNYENNSEDFSGNLNRDFIVSPFSVLDGRAHFWLDKKRAWKMKMGDGGDGRSEDLISDAAMLKFKNNGNGTSMFDPFLCEILYKWFCKEGASIFDPFCGGITRGFVAQTMGYDYTGVDVRKEQIEANKKISNKHGKKASFVLGDSEFIDIPAHDLLFSCPPYLSLEKYSSQEDDISTLPTEAFNKKYDTIIKRSCEKLKIDGYAVFVLSDVRATKGPNKGFYEDFIGMTIGAFKKSGLELYNRMVYLSPLVSAPLRARSTFRTKKVVKTHEEILVFKRVDN